MTANYDQHGKLSYYDYSSYPLIPHELDARRDPKLPRAADNVSAHHRIRYSVAGGQRGLDDIASGKKRA